MHGANVDAAPATGMFKKLRACPSFPEAKARLLAGVPPTRVAVYMHECGDYLSLTLPNLVTTLCAYRRTLSSMELVATCDPKFVQDAKGVISDAMDEMEELAAIYKIQKERIVQGRDLEKKIGVLNKSLGNEVRIAGEILRTSATIKEQLGLADATPHDIAPTHRYDTRARFGERVAGVIEDPGKRNKVMGAVNALLAASVAKQGA
jgi:hypothetical protein